MTAKSTCRIVVLSNRCEFIQDTRVIFIRCSRGPELRTCSLAARKTKHASFGTCGRPKPFKLDLKNEIYLEAIDVLIIMTGVNLCYI